MMEEFAEKKNAVLARLEARQKGEESVDAENAKWADFGCVFIDSANVVAESLEKIQKDGPEQKDLTEKLDAAMVEIGKLQRFFNESASFLPAFETQKHQKTLADLNSSFQAIRLQLKPQKKFGFKSRPAAPKAPKVDEEKRKKSTKAYSDENAVVLERRRGESLVLDDVTTGKDVLLSDLENCQVRIRGSPSTLHIAKLRNSSVFADPVSTSVFLEDCSSSKLALASQQLRMHSSRDLVVNLHVTSRGIIEDCSDILFAPYSIQGISSDAFAEANLDPGINNWQIIQDFNWLSNDAPSPNWSIEPEDQWTPVHIS